MRLLIADDSELLRSHLVEMLSEIKGIVVVGEARNSREAIAQVENLNPDLVILDIRMPGGDGLVALEAIRKIQKKPIQVVVFTNHPYLQYRKKCMDAGADFFFYKAREFDKLIKTMQDLARSS